MWKLKIASGLLSFSFSPLLNGVTCPCFYVSSKTPTVKIANLIVILANVSKSRATLHLRGLFWTLICLTLLMQPVLSKYNEGIPSRAATVHYCNVAIDQKL